MSTNVAVGQVWADKDKRRQGRQLRVEGISDGYAQCSTRQGGEGEFSQKRSRIKLDRFSRYNLIGDAQEEKTDLTPPAPYSEGQSSTGDHAA